MEDGMQETQSKSSVSPRSGLLSSKLGSPLGVVNQTCLSSLSGSPSCSTFSSSSLSLQPFLKNPVLNSHILNNNSSILGRQIMTGSPS